MGDDDFDYKGGDLVIGREAIKLPVALGVNRYEQAYHLGYPNADLGGKQFVHR